MLNVCISAAVVRVTSNVPSGKSTIKIEITFAVDYRILSVNKVMKGIHSWVWAAAYLRVQSGISVYASVCVMTYSANVLHFCASMEDIGFFSIIHFV